jgi:asparagine synthase (glutamine-hydrolysing)
VGEPFGDASYIPTRLLAGITRKDVTVALSGDAADEIYGGYDTYRAFMLAQYYPHFAHKFLRFVSEILPEPNRKVSAILKMKRFFRTYSPDVVERHFDWMATYADEGRKDLLLKHFRNKYEFNLFDSTEGNGLRDVQVADLSHYLSSGILQKVDMASMSCGLEVRVPFLSPDVVAQALALPDSLKITLRHRKIRLKEMAVGYIPDWVGKRPKRGFTSPLRVWFQRSELLREYVLGEKYFEHGFFERDFAERLFVSNLSGDDCSRELWLLFGFNFWYYHKFLGM